MTETPQSRPLRKAFGRRTMSSLDPPSTPPPKSTFKKPPLPTPDVTPTKKIRVNNYSQVYLEPRSSASPCTPDDPPTQLSRKRSYVDIFDGDSDDDDFADVPIYPSKLKASLKTYNDHSQLTPYPSPGSAGERSRQLENQRTSQVIRPPDFSVLYRGEKGARRANDDTTVTSQATKPSDRFRNLEDIDARSSVRAMGPSPSPPPTSPLNHRRQTSQDAFNHSASTSSTPPSNHSSQQHQPYPQPRPRVSFPPIPKLRISPTELSRTAEIILTRMNWEEVAVFVAANRSGIRYREAVGVALGWIAGLLEEYEEKGRKGKGARKCDGGGGGDGSGRNSEGIYEEDDVYDPDAREDVMVEEEEEEEEEEERNRLGDRRIPVIGGWADNDDVLHKVEEEDKECVWDGCDD